MIQIFCSHHHSVSRGELCKDCFSLYMYAIKRLDCCPFGSEKGNCSSCKIHCYKPDMREKMCEVMRFAGPRMMWYHPVDAIKHLWRER